MTTYRYHRHIKWVSLAIPIVLGPTGIAGVAMGFVWESAFLLGLGCLLVAEGGLLWWMMSRMAATEISMGPDDLNII